MSAHKAINMRATVHALQSKLSCAAKQSLERKFGALYDKVYREDVVRVAWDLVKANDGVPGVDRQDFEYIENKIGVEEFLSELRDDLRAEKYRPLPVLRCWIEKPGKPEKRPLGIPIIRDRVAQMAMKLVIEPLFEANFLNCSHGFRKGLSCHTAMDMIRRAITFDGYTTVIDADITGCFSNIRHDLLLKLVGRRINDKRVIRLLRAWLKAGVMEDGVYEEAGEAGTPQGGVISPLLSNIYLHSFDKMFQESGIAGKLVRYADDFVVLVKESGTDVLERIREMLKRLGLQMHPEKTRLTSAYRGFDFLSVHFRMLPVRKKTSRLKECCRLWPSDKAVERIKEKIRLKIGRRYGLTLEELMQEINPVIRGWNNYQARMRPERSRFTKLNDFLYDQIRIFLKRKYSDQSRGYRRVLGNLPVQLGCAQFGW
jgi:group II intron reverse transcriptase/maturase